jgi:putative hydrolase of the HAD superfamily
MMKEKPVAVLFDMGSTLSLQMPTRENLLSQFLHDHGHERSPQDVRRALLAGDTWWHRWNEQHPFGWADETKRKDMRQQYRDVFLESLGLASDDGLREPLADVWGTSIMRRHNALFPDALPTLRTLRERGLRLAIVSNWDSSLQSHCDDLGLTPLFETIVGSYAVGYEKPDPRIFQVALERMSLLPPQVVHVGDIYVSDVVGARRAGITPILLDRYDLQPDADCLRIDSLDDIPSLLQITP